MSTENSDSDAPARGDLGAIGAIGVEPYVIIRNSTQSDGVENSVENATQTTHKTTHRICKCGDGCRGKATRCGKCESAYRKAKRAQAKADAVIDFAINVVARPNKTYSVLVTSNRLEGDEASRGKLYGPYATRKEAHAKAALVDQALEVWGFANGW